MFPPTESCFKNKTGNDESVLGVCPAETSLCIPVVPSSQEEKKKKKKKVNQLLLMPLE